MKLTEKQKNCPYCHVNSDIGVTWMDGELQFDAIIDDSHVQTDGDVWGDIWFDPKNHFLKSWGEDTDPLIIDIAYCPMCGRPLNEEEE